MGSLSNLHRQHAPSTPPTSCWGCPCSPRWYRRPPWPPRPPWGTSRRASRRSPWCRSPRSRPRSTSCSSAPKGSSSSSKASGPPCSTTPLNITSPAQLLTVHHLVHFPPDGLPPREPPSVGSALCRYTSARCPGGALCKGGPRGSTTATPSWCPETRVPRELPGSRLRSLVGSQLPTYPRQCQ